MTGRLKHGFDSRQKRRLSWRRSRKANIDGLLIMSLVSEATEEIVEMTGGDHDRGKELGYSERQDAASI